ncbi:MAG: hypothetical protein FWE20_10685 [Defluviitaleaceae bacterium]|nr:hypothetical protein [Defluviitaleaceae bacterium]
MKIIKVSTFIAIVCLFVLTPVITVFGWERTEASPSFHRVLVNGEHVQIAGYNISGVNYFRLRDIAYALNGSAAQFNLVWDATMNGVRIYTETPYVSIGGELEYIASSSAVATRSEANFSVDGNNVSFHFFGGFNPMPQSIPVVININGNNFFQLRYIGDLVGFHVGFVGAYNTVLINGIIP